LRRPDPIKAIEAAVADAARYIRALTTLPTDPDYEKRLDALLAKQDPGTRKKLNVKRVDQKS